VASLLDQLDRRESVLLMHLAGELSAGDRAEVQRRLAADPALAADLERLRSTHDFIFGGLDRLDVADPLPVAPAVAAKRVGDVLRQRLSVAGARRARPAAKPAPYDIPRRIVGWAAVAAAIAVAASVIPQLAPLWRSNPNRVAKVGGPGGTGRLQNAEAVDTEQEIDKLAFDKWVRPNQDLLEELADATEEMSGAAQPVLPEAGPRSPREDGGTGGTRAVETDDGSDIGDGPMFNIPPELPEPAQPPTGRRA